MTREEAIKTLSDIDSARRNYSHEEYVALEMAIKALEQEPCEDAISFPKGTLKKRVKGYVVYNPEWLKENWRTELRVMGIECEDAISRDYLLSIANTDGAYGYVSAYDIAKAPSVTPKQKMGRWIYTKAVSTGEIIWSECSVCGEGDRGCAKRMKFCPNCGAWMSLPKPYRTESED